MLCLSFLVCRANLFSFLLTPLVCYYNILPRPPLLSRAYDVGRTRQDAHGDVDRYDDECDIIASRYTRRFIFAVRLPITQAPLKGSLLVEEWKASHLFQLPVPPLPRALFY